MNNLQLILGGPGCGKTTALIQIVQDALRAGIAPEQIAFVAFTKAAAAEAKARASAALGIVEDQMPWFRTIHSLAYQCLGLSRDEVMDKEDWKEFGDMIGERITGGRFTHDDRYAGDDKEKGDKLLRLTEFAATTMMSLREVFDLLSEDVSWWELRRFDEALRKFKGSISKLDFSDMLLTYAEEGDPLNIKLAVIDEAQDLTRAQWCVVERAFSRANRVYIGGDDDQAIYRWAGADVDHFLSLTSAPNVLPVSHRLAPRIHAMGGLISSRISRRYRKLYRARESATEGEVIYHHDIDTVPISRDGTWLLLARNGYLLQQWEDRLRTAGLPYRTRKGSSVRDEERDGIALWERIQWKPDSIVTAKELRLLSELCFKPRPSLKEFAEYRVGDFLDVNHTWFFAFDAIPPVRRDYYMECLKHGELFNAPRFRVETIHGVKGGEADHVAMMSDMSWKTAKAYEAEPDTEHRVFYVGATRARDSLHLVAPSGAAAYDMPIISA